ncbi:MAG: MBL fold metallo-hydrolase [Calditrichaeota bacterium]|nr:MAG: MBL fold metallo-hydrolase [Calditrichota bacterium]
MRNKGTGFVILVMFLCIVGKLFGHAGKTIQDDTQIKTIHVSGNIYMLEGSGGNIGVSAGPDGVLMIDDQFATLSSKIREAVRKINPGEIKFLVNTHHHGDHTGGNKFFSEEAVILAHHNVRKHLSDNGEKQIPGLPIITFEDGLSIHFNDEEIKVIHWAGGHTDGDAVVHFQKSNVVHMGDQMFAGRFPYIDLNDGGDVQKYISNVEALLNKLPEDIIIIPGHGNLSTKADLRIFYSMLVETTDLIRLKIKNGVELNAILKEGLPDKWQDWAWSFISEEKWIKIVYTSFTR